MIECACDSRFAPARGSMGIVSASTHVLPEGRGGRSCVEGRGEAGRAQLAGEARRNGARGAEGKQQDCAMARALLPVLPWNGGGQGW